MYLIVPMSGQGTRFLAAGYRVPKPLVDLDGAPMIARVLQQYPTEWPVVAVTADNHRDTALRAVVTQERPHATLVEVAQHKEGPAIAIEAALPHVPDDAPILVSYCDFGMVWDPQAFARMVKISACDAALITYRGFQPHYASQTPYAYARLDGERVVEVREKGSFTSDRENEHASAGAYYFRNKQLLQRALDAQREKDLRVNNELYTSLTVEALLQCEPDAYVRVFEASHFFQWGTPQDVEDYLYWHKTYHASLRNGARASSSVSRDFVVEQVVMPMAGGGTRFRARSPIAKPLLPVDQEPMFVAATRSLPVATGRRVYVARQSDAQAVAGAADGAPGAGAEIVSLQATPPGQALSTKAALGSLDADAPVLVSACDHGIVLAPARWRAFRAAPDCEAAIFTQSGYPGARRQPQSFAYVAEDPSDSAAPFPRIGRISVKQPLSDSPARDAVLVGTFWFRSVTLLQHAIALLIERDERVNGELYLDTALKILLERGHTLRMLALDGYINWGAPDAYDEALYWRQAFLGLAPHPPRGALPPPSPWLAAHQSNSNKKEMRDVGKWAPGRKDLVEPIGIEPTTSGLQSPRSPS